MLGGKVGEGARNRGGAVERVLQNRLGGDIPGADRRDQVTSVMTGSLTPSGLVDADGPGRSADAPGRGDVVLRELPVTAAGEPARSQPLRTEKDACPPTVTRPAGTRARLQKSQRAERVTGTEKRLPVSLIEARPRPPIALSSSLRSAM